MNFMDFVQSVAVLNVESCLLPTSLWNNSKHNFIFREN